LPDENGALAFSSQPRLDLSGGMFARIDAISMRAVPMWAMPMRPGELTEIGSQQMGLALLCTVCSVATASALRFP
jgi:hypothetical protein